MATRAMVALVILLFLSSVALVPAQAPISAPPAFTPVSPPPAQLGPPIVCTLPNTTMISPNYCNARDEQSMVIQTADCQGFLTMSVETPTVECCTGLNNVAYNRTSCICKKAFYPPAGNNASRQLDLPRLCGVRTDLCGQCPMFTVPSGTGGSSYQTPPGRLAETSTASTVGAISMAVIFGVLLVGFTVFFGLMLIRKRRERNNAAASFEPPPPGGAF